MKCPLILDLIIGFQEIQKCVAIMGGYYMIFFLNSIDVSKMPWSYKSKKKIDKNQGITKLIKTK